MLKCRASEKGMVRPQELALSPPFLLPQTSRSLLGVKNLFLFNLIHLSIHFSIHPIIN